jgi:ribosomal protein L19
MAEVNAVAIALNERRLSDWRPPLEQFNVGDAVAVTYALESSEAAPAPVRGVVIGARRKGLDSRFTILNAQDEEWYAATYTLASPLLRGVKVLRRNHHSDGKKRARRAKLNYLFDRDHKTYAVDAYTKETAEVLREKRERKEAQRAGKTYRAAIPAAAAAAAAKKAEGAKGGAKAAGKPAKKA